MMASQQYIPPVDSVCATKEWNNLPLRVSITNIIQTVQMKKWLVSAQGVHPKLGF
jgi:hypothetical protein